MFVVESLEVAQIFFKHTQTKTEKIAKEQTQWKDRTELNFDGTNVTHGNMKNVLNNDQVTADKNPAENAKTNTKSLLNRVLSNGRFEK